MRNRCFGSVHRDRDRGIAGCGRSRRRSGDRHATQTSAAAAPRWDPLGPRTASRTCRVTGASEAISRHTASRRASPIAKSTRESAPGAARGQAGDRPSRRQDPMLPGAAEKAAFHYSEHTRPSKVEYLDPVSRCFEEGVPRINYQGNMRILQFPKCIVILHEFGHHYRVIYLDGRPPVGDTLKLWMGDSRGRWEGNTLVVDVTNHNDKTWFDIVGSFHSDAMRVQERWTFASADRIDYVATIEIQRCSRGRGSLR